MKKQFASILIILALLIGIFVVPVAAAGTMNLTVSSPSGQPGGEVTVNISVANNPGLASLKFDVAYDSALTLKNVTFNSAFGAYATTPTPYKNPQTLTMISPLAAVSANGVFATLTFTVSADAQIGHRAPVTISYAADDIFDSDYEPVQVSVTNGAVTVACAHGSTKNVPEEPATCGKSGYSAGVYCNDCKTYISGHTVIGATGNHTWGAWTKVDEANHKHTCTVCKAASETKKHSWDNGVETTPATCQKTGVKTFTCSGCNATKTEDIAKKPHTWGNWTKVDDNQHKRTCTACKTETETSTHRWDSGEVTKEATCKDTGVKTYTCSVCTGTKTETIPVDTTAHKFETKWSKLDDNQHQAVCTVCKTEKKLENHKWDSGKVTKEATCKDTGVKTYTCSVCNGTKTETVPVDPTAHSFGTWTRLDNDKHERTCTICKTEKEQENHNKQNGMVTKAATCVAEGEKTYTCSVCTGTTVEKLPVDPAAHKLGSWANLDADKHAQSCTLCSTVQKQENHKWDEGKVSKDSTCKEVGVKTYTCATCKATKTEEIPMKEHTFGKWESISDSQHKRTCTMCKTEAETVNHTFTEKDNWSKDEKQHYHVCECGAKKDAADHTPGAEPTEKDPQICTVCKYIIKPALGHTHTWDTKLTTDETGHWYDCPGCEDKKDFKEHDFANDCDGLCETCQYTRTTEHKFGTDWASDETGHFHACSVCGEKIDFAEHTPGEEATEETAQTCTVCAYEVTPALGHTHVFAEEWKHNGQGHWHECVCEEKADEADHTWVDGACSVCGAAQPLEVDDEAGFPWIIVIIAVLGVGAVVAAVILLKKKKK